VPLFAITLVWAYFFLSAEAAAPALALGTVIIGGFEVLRLPRAVVGSIEPDKPGPNSGLS